jgi:hypothetical protein
MDSLFIRLASWMSPEKKCPSGAIGDESLVQEGQKEKKMEMEKVAVCSNVFSHSLTILSLFIHQLSAFMI